MKGTLKRTDIETDYNQVENVEASLKIEPDDSTYRQMSAADIEPGEGTLSKSILAESSLMMHLDENLPVADIEPGEGTLCESTCLTAGSSVKMQLDESLYREISIADKGQGEETLGEIHLAESTCIKLEPDDDAYQQTSAADIELGEGTLGEMYLAESTSIKQQTSAADIELGEGTLGESVVAGFFVKLEPDDQTHWKTSVVKPPVRKSQFGVC
ncbi:uncharacterized protein LOC117315735 [Pecten maximus]|uniref:uncharacterized protein LOC117315735 n=1 Tax=Pecten maximus TaxID=6579 RepID=UPI001458AF07|nr:uncharacterized protein LOC117315735 [Pecten maximus]